MEMKIMAKKKDQPKSDMPADERHGETPDANSVPQATATNTSEGASDTASDNKSEAVRQVLQEHGLDTPPAKVREILAAKGIEVSPSNVYQTKARMVGGGGKKKRGDGGSDDHNYEELLTVKEFAKEVGGLERLKRLCDVLLRLQQD
jgi:hypothetical protein